VISDKFVILGALINLIGSSRYVIDTLRGKAKPNRVTWFLWALAPLIAFGAEIGQGVGLQSLMTFMVGFGPLMVFIASFVNRKAVWKITGFDIFCGILTLLGLILWLLTRHCNIAIAFSIFADGLAALPTIVKAYRQPETESYLVFMNGAISAGITLLTIDHWTFAYYGFPIYILTTCVLLFILIRIKPQKALILEGNT
jgi:hypothetical protein